MNAAEVVAALYRRYGCVNDSLTPEWAALPEFALSPGGGGRRIDVLFVRSWSGAPKGHERHAVEVKVSRADFLAELAHPEKRAAFVAVAHRFFFATPAGLVAVEEVPDGCGLLEVEADGTVTLKVRARRCPSPQDMAPAAFVEAFRRAGRAEGRLRAPQTGDLSAELGDTRRALRSAQAAEERAKSALRVERARTAQLVSHLSHGTLTPCRCGGCLVPLRTKAHYVTWVHAKESDPVCPTPVPDLAAFAAKCSEL